MKKDYRDLLSSGFIGVLYIFAVLKATLVPMHVPVASWHMLLFTLGAFIFYTLLNTHTGRIVFLSGMLIGAGYMAFTVIKDGMGILSDFFAPVVRLMQVMAQVGTGYYNETIPYAWLMYAIGVYSLLVAMPIYYFMVRCFRFYLLIVPGLVFFMTVWGINRHIDKLSFYIFAVIAIVSYIRHIYTRNKKKDGDFSDPSSAGRILIYYIPVAIVIIFISILIPEGSKPVQWPWMDEKISRVWRELEQKFSIDRYDSFSLANTGFGDPARLGGPVRPDDTPIMVVEAPTRLYLRGAAYDCYNGMGWEVSERQQEDFQNDRVFDHREMRFGWKAADNAYSLIYAGNDLQALSNINDTDGYIGFLKLEQLPREISRLYPEKEVRIRHLNVRTKTLFTPLKLFIPITGLSSEGYKLEEGFGGIFKVNKRLAGNISYKVNYLQPGYGMPEMEEFFRISRQGLYSDFIKYNSRFLDYLENSGINNPDTARRDVEAALQIYRQLDDHRNAIYNQYTQIPEGLPARVRFLANDIARGTRSVYDRIKAIEHYLRQNYNYTLSPQYPPADQDFVDYFLFDGKEGYCSYYASAMCVMLRTVGIPARYVEGFVLPDQPDENNQYVVTNRNAHAWVEVYLEGIGWVTFEPTTPYASAMNYYIKLNEGNPDKGHEYDDIPGFDPEEHNEQYREGKDFDWDVNGRDEMTASVFWLGLLAVILAVFLANMLFVPGKWSILRLMSPRKSIPAIYNYMVSLLRQSGCAINTGETPKDFAKRVDSRYQFVYMTMDEMAELFYRVRYGAHELDKKSTKKLFRFILEVKTKSGRNMYLIKRIIYRGFFFRG